MTLVDQAMVALAMAMMGASVGNRRAWQWLLAIMASYAVSTLYWRYGGMHAAFVAGMCDAMICLAIYFLARRRWEIITGRILLVSVAVNLVYYPGSIGLTPLLGPQLAYALVLEGLVVLSLLWVGGAGATQLVGGDDDVSAPRFLRRLHRALLPLYQPRARQPFWACPARPARR